MTTPTRRRWTSDGQWSSGQLSRFVIPDHISPSPRGRVRYHVRRHHVRTYLALVLAFILVAGYLPMAIGLWAYRWTYGSLPSFWQAMSYYWSLVR